MWVIELFYHALIKPFWFIWIIIIGFIILRILTERAIAKHNSKVEYENQKQAFKDALKEHEKESK